MDRADAASKTPNGDCLSRITRRGRSKKVIARVSSENQTLYRRTAGVEFLSDPLLVVASVTPTATCKAEHNVLIMQKDSEIRE